MLASAKTSLAILFADASAAAGPSGLTSTSNACSRLSSSLTTMRRSTVLPEAQNTFSTAFSIAISATTVGGFGRDMGLFMRPVATMRFMAKTKTC